MNQETLNCLVFMVFGLGFYLLIYLLITRDHREGREWRMMELREFGTKRPSEIDTPDPPEER